MSESAGTGRFGRILVLTAAAFCTLAPALMAQTGDTPAATASAAAAPAVPSQGSWLDRWMQTVDEARASQPHYVAPIVTTHVVLVEQYRYDLSRQEDASGTVTSNFGASRGLEIIPTTRLEIGISPPPYFTHQSAVPRWIWRFVVPGEVSRRFSA